MAYQKEWWHVDEHGRRIGWMEPVEFEAILAGYYGDRNWVDPFSTQFGITQPTVYRYSQGITPIPKTIASIVLMLAELGGPDKCPKVVAPWLPKNPKRAEAQQEKPKRSEKAA